MWLFQHSFMHWIVLGRAVDKLMYGVWLSCTCMWSLNLLWVLVVLTLISDCDIHIVQPLMFVWPTLITEFYSALLSFTESRNADMDLLLRSFKRNFSIMLCQLMMHLNIKLFCVFFFICLFCLIIEAGKLYVV